MKKLPGQFSVSHSLTYQVLPWVCQSPVKIILSLRTFSDLGQKIFSNQIGNKFGPKLILSWFSSAEAVLILKRSRRCCRSEMWSDIFWQKFWPEKFNRWWFQVCSIDLSQKCYGLNLFLRKKRFIAHFQISLSGLSVVPALKLIQVLLIRAPLRCQMSEPSLTWIKLRFVFLQLSDSSRNRLLLNW